MKYILIYTSKEIELHLPYIGGGQASFILISMIERKSHANIHPLNLFEKNYGNLSKIKALVDNLEENY